MKRIEPPPLATWILDHCIPGQRDQALAGDLLETFQEGRSNGWYWRQALAAWLVGWAKYLGDRASLIVFALLWSMMAPAWAAMVDWVQNRDVPWPASVAAWLMLNLVFVWTGMLAFAGLHRRAAVTLNMKKLKRAFAVAAAVFLPTYFATYVLANLFAWPGLAVNWRTIHPFGAIIDLGFWADALRFPYFVTLLWSLWDVTPRLGIAPARAIEWSSPRGSRHDGANQTDAASITPVRRRDAYAVKRMLVFMVGAGLLNALIAGFLLCRLPEAHHPSLGSIFARATIYVGVGAIAGVMGTYVYWSSPSSAFRADPPLPFSLFALVCAAGWVWVPAMVLFSEQVSALSAGVAMIAAFLVSGEMRRIVLLLFRATEPESSPPPVAETHLFAETLYRAPAEPYGYLIALCIYGAGWATAERWNMAAGTLLALGACVFQMKATFLPNRNPQTLHEYRRAVLRLAGVVLPAVLVTIWALLDGVAHRNHLAAVNAAMAANANSSGEDANRKAQDKNSARAGNGYESVILWPYPPKKQIVAPVQETSLLAPGTVRPVVIRFDGEYWYLQPPDDRPGPRAHQAQGTPLETHIASANSFPLIMQAHEFLRFPIRLARCREIRVEIASREIQPGTIAVAVWLKSSQAAGVPSVYLGQEPVTSVGAGPSRPGAGSAAGPAAAPAHETLVFAVPAATKMRRFDQITVMMLPDSGHQFVGPQIAIEQFELIPR